MRARNIKPGFFKNEQLPDCTPLTRLLFIGLWCMADREGLLEDRPRKLKIEVFPCDDCDIDAMLEELQATGFIRRYEIEGRRYVQVVNFKKHQRPHNKEQASTIPAPTWDGVHASGMAPKARARTAPDTGAPSSIPPDSLIPDSLIPESSHSDDARVREEMTSRSPPKASHRTRLPHETLPLDWLQWAQTDRGWSAETTTDVWVGFQDYWQEKTGKTARKSDWFSTWRVWCRSQKISKQGSYDPNLRHYSQNTPANKTDRARAAIIQSAANHGYATVEG